MIISLIFERSETVNAWLKLSNLETHFSTLLECAKASYVLYMPYAVDTCV
jgi:hypothetical protein